MVRVLIDTNILVYAHQPAERAKHARSVEVLEGLADPGAWCVSTQVLAEFVSATTRGRRPLLSMADAIRQAERLAVSLPVLDVTRMVVLEAFRGIRQHRLSLFDAQIWATARLNQVDTVFSEDFQDGAVLDGVRFLNPLAPTFDHDRWS